MFLRSLLASLLGVLGVLGVLLSSCLPQDGTGTTSSSSSGTSGTADADSGAKTPAGQACLDTADAFAAAEKRCGSDYTTARNNLIRDLANGDCESVSIRNVAELRAQCFPSLARISCSDLQNQRVDPSCAEQIMRTK
jgi:hypothetical protein